MNRDPNNLPAPKRWAGLGDVVESVAKVTGAAALVKAIKPDCGCAGRKAKLNKLVPFTRPAQTDGPEPEGQPEAG